MRTSVSVVGLGKLGACMAAAMASRGVMTVGVDVSDVAVARVQRKLAPVFEPGLGELMAGLDGVLSARTDLESAVHDTQITFVVVPTPSNTQGAFSLEHVQAAMTPIARAIRDKSSHHLVVLTSTVLPGSTEFFVKPMLEGISGKRCGCDFGLCYSPEFIALGSVLRDFLNPDLLLIGECTADAGKQLAGFYRDSLQMNAPAARVAPINAELAKISLNSFVTTKITFANLLAEICERLPGGDVDAVTQALGLDQRIGAKYLKGALGYGGPCFPRDNNAFARFLETMGVAADLPRTVDRMNRRQAMRITSIVEQCNPGKSRRVAVLGLAYKPDTNVVEESQGIAIAGILAKQGFEVSVFDPVAMEPAKGLLGDAVEYADSIASCLRGAEVVVLATEWPEFRSVPSQLSKFRPRPIILDGWRMLKSGYGPDALWYRGVGLEHPHRETRERLARFVADLGEAPVEVEETNQAPGAKAAIG
jgi:UDPglucose 6-dehydrogenase